MKIIFICIALGMGPTLFSQSKNQYDQYVSSISTISEAILQSLSGKKGEKRDWERFRNLFL
jgi:hypothetical protein